MKGNDTQTELNWNSTLSSAQLLLQAMSVEVVITTTAVVVNCNHFYVSAESHLVI